MKIFITRINRKNIIFIALLFVIVICFLLFPPLIRFSCRHNSDQIVTIEKVIGKWVQIKDINLNMQDDASDSSSPTYVIFKENAEYYLKYKCGSSPDYLEMCGKWHYDSRPYYFLGFVPMGYRNLIKLDFGHESLYQFYLKTDKEGYIYLYRYAVACISNKEFVKDHKSEETQSIKN